MLTIVALPYIEMFSFIEPADFTRILWLTVWLLLCSCLCGKRWFPNVNSSMGSHDHLVWLSVQQSPAQAGDFIQGFIHWYTALWFTGHGDLRISQGMKSCWLYVCLLVHTTTSKCLSSFPLWMYRSSLQPDKDKEGFTHLHTKKKQQAKNRFWGRMET